jgi:hypothetical protein
MDNNSNQDSEGKDEQHSHAKQENVTKPKLFPEARNATHGLDQLRSLLRELLAAFVENLKRIAEFHKRRNFTF